MIACKKCGYESLNAEERCPRCNAAIELSSGETQSILEKLALARAEREYPAVVEYVKILAWCGHTDYEREYALMLEKGDTVGRNYDEAMRFFARAAVKHDAYSAFRYSKLLGRVNEKASRFWLLYAAVLGCPDSYPKAAELLSKEGYDKDASYFYILSAKHDDIDSIVTIASRYCKGIGCPVSPEYAKWYMDKLSFPPLYAFKLAHKLKGVSPKEPPEELFDKEPLIRRLLAMAEQFGFKEAYFKLTEMLAELSDVSAMTVLATLYADGVGCRKDIGEAVRIFTEAAALGSEESYVCLANIFLGGFGLEASPELAERYLLAAEKLGSAEASFRLGELYEAGEFFAKDLKKAEAHYRIASDRGVGEAAVRADRIVALRRKFFDDAMESRGKNPEKAFKALAIATAMGHKAAIVKLADAYLKGEGTKQDKSTAFYWYSEAVLAGDDSALYPLGLCYFMGVGVNRNFAKAKDVLLRAVSAGSEGAKITLKRLYEGKRKKLAQKLYSKAMRLVYMKKYRPAHAMLLLAIELSSAKAQYILGCMYEFGLGVDCDRGVASEYYAAAYNGGFIDKNAKYKKLVLKLIR